MAMAIDTDTRNVATYVHTCLETCLSRYVAEETVVDRQSLAHDRTKTFDRRNIEKCAW
ncbi:hypothetical protein WN51_04462 [Melipona quadrifasciata]|uniref:Uncharacterized protein n=1 Tax=Melipona quadrifasciata TaxID=166423 RepID=A0A0M8ZSB0_9HYME|nr:hypothetical protein WN51_04462 [Melipona quadrifasciata]